MSADVNRQHFGSIRLYGEQSDFKDQLERDLAKNRWAGDHGASILRTPYQEYDRVEEELKKFFRALEKNEYKQIFRVTNPNLYNQLARDGRAMGIK